MTEKIEIEGSCVYFKGLFIGWISNDIFRPTEDCPKNIIDHFYNRGWAIKR